jgi:hypothetical protein
LTTIEVYIYNKKKEYDNLIFWSLYFNNKKRKRKTTLLKCLLHIANPNAKTVELSSLIPFYYIAYVVTQYIP